MPQHTRTQPRRASDRNWALRLVGVAVVVVMGMFATGFFLTRHWKQDAEERAQKEQIEMYLQSTKAAERPVAAAQESATPPGPSPAQMVRAKLLAHPAVTPGPGFDRPGVQATGLAIVDAIDTAQSRQGKVH